jgi:hypothetical protein
MEQLNRQLFRGCAIVRDPHHQRENQPMRLFVQRGQRMLVPGRDRLDELDPVSLGDACLRSVGIEQIAQRSRL